MRYKALALLLCLCGLCVSCSTSSNYEDHGFSNSLPPGPDWEEIDARGKFTFYLPAGLEKQNVHGIDSYVGAFESPSLKVTFDYGWYSGLPGSQGKEDYTKEETRIGGRKAVIVSFRLDNGGAKQGYTYLTAVHFPTVTAGEESEKNKLTMSAFCKAENDLSTAQAIFASIRFP